MVASRKPRDFRVTGRVARPWTPLQTSSIVTLPFSHLDNFALFPAPAG